MDETPIVVVDDATIKVMIGSLEGCTSPVFTFSPAFYFHVELPAGGRLDLPVDPNHNAFVHMIEGQLEGEGRQLLHDEQLALYERGGDVMRFHALEDSRILGAGRSAAQRAVGQLRAVCDELPRPNQRLHPQLPRRPDGPAFKPGRICRPGTLRIGLADFIFRRCS